MRDKEREALERIKNIEIYSEKEVDDNDYCTSYSFAEYEGTLEDLHTKDTLILENAIVQLEEAELENKGLKIVIEYQKQILNALRNNFNLYKSRDGANLEIIQTDQMNPDEVAAVKEFFGGISE